MADRMGGLNWVQAGEVASPPHHRSRPCLLLSFCLLSFGEIDADAGESATRGRLGLDDVNIGDPLFVVCDCPVIMVAVHVNDYK
jgi:hypothetical protein